MSRKTFRKIITTPELLEQINPKNKKLVESFLREKNTRSSDKTIQGYKSDLDIFLTWNLQNNENKFFTDIRKLEFVEFFAFAVDELRFGSARFNRLRSTLSSLSIFIEKFMDDLNYKNIVLRAIEGLPKNPRRDKTILSEEQVNGLLKFLTDKGYYQDACLLALAISSGARLSELLRFTTDLIDENNVAFNGIFLVTTKKIRTKGRTKQGKMLAKYIIKDIFMPYYRQWLPIREKILKENGKEDHGFIFIKDNGDIAEEASIRSWIRKWEVFLKVPFYLHSLRHYLTTYLTKIGLPQELVVEIFGWESGDAMFRIYNDLGVRDRKWSELSKLQDALNKPIVSGQIETLPGKISGWEIS
jgi:site-specific recombinase XerD